MFKIIRRQQDWLRLRRLVQQVTIHPQDAEDHLQSGLVKLLSAQETVKNPQGFLVTASRNQSIDSARRAKSFDSASQHPEDLRLGPVEQVLPDEVFDARKRLERVSDALDALPARTRRIFLMHRLDGLKYREIAARELVSVSSVEKHIAKAVLAITEWDDRD